jgi:hypothetical protein
LGLIGNSIQYTRRLKKREQDLWNRISFQTEFSEIFKGSISHDPSGSGLCQLFFDDNDSRFSRITWQNQGARFRVIPYIDCEATSEDGILKRKRISGKKAIPVIYLGLSRLYPIGVASAFSQRPLTTHKALKDLSNEDWVRKHVASILQINDEINGIDTFTFSGEAPSKVGVGFSHSTYPAISKFGSTNLDNYKRLKLAKTPAKAGVLRF